MTDNDDTYPEYRTHRPMPIWCHECGTKVTTTACEQCGYPVCSDCWIDIHCYNARLMEDPHAG